LKNLNTQKEEFEKRIHELNDKKIEVRSDLNKIKYEGIESMTRKQIDEVETNVAEAQNRFERNKDKLERINKVLIDSKAGIEHLCDKLIDIKLDDSPNVAVADETLVEALMQIEKKSEFIYKEIKDDPMYDEVMGRICGLKLEKLNEDPLHK
jgi:uncharacterized coiled-coil protein SlyX